MHSVAKRQRTVPTPPAAPTPANSLKKPLELLFEEFRYVPKSEKAGAAGAWAPVSDGPLGRGSGSRRRRRRRRRRRLVV